MKSTAMFVILTSLVSGAWTSGVAHPFTVKGTVVSADPARIAISVVDDKTKKTTIQAFAINDETVILRGEKQVTFAAAKILKGESAAVTAEVDDRDDWAEVIRLPAATSAR